MRCVPLRHLCAPADRTVVRLVTRPCVAAAAAFTGQLIWLAVVNGTPCQQLGPWNLILYVLAGLGGMAEANAARLRGNRRGVVVAWGLGSAALLLVTALVVDGGVSSRGGCYSKAGA